MTIELSISLKEIQEDLELISTYEERSIPVNLKDRISQVLLRFEEIYGFKPNKTDPILLLRFIKLQRKIDILKDVLLQ